MDYVSIYEAAALALQAAERECVWLAIGGLYLASAFTGGGGFTGAILGGGWAVSR